MFIRTVFAALIAVAGSAAVALDDPQTVLQDPMGSGMWNYHQKGLLGDPADIRFDDRVVLRAPDSAEDSLNVPLLVDATAIPDVKRIVISADYGPIPHILTYYPEQAEPKLALRFKIDQATAIRASVETAGAVRVATDRWLAHAGKSLITSGSHIPILMTLSPISSLRWCQFLKARTRSATRERS
ncbi:thiosulfate oxidation carrier protein SoxY [uncultured Mameliella sp.]|uniref:thiosulfate oxidation carrier protein SoxY n=1 Tax=uncultured Mameliella sp. TaxID=1447087 RepID=UPI00261F44E7|nr:thiosulfate oxidation carrier protein SoxY [uncultured Mameliella sp.]